MTKLAIFEDEAYPVYWISSDLEFYDALIDLADFEIDWIKTTIDEYWKVQNFLEKRYYESRAQSDKAST